MELSAYIVPLRKWWWLLAAATLVAALSSFLATSQQQPVYQSSTTILIGSTIDDPNPSSGEFTLSMQLAGTYADIAMREQVRNATREALGIDFLPQYRAEALPNSQIVEIAVVDTNPVRAQAVANELANQLILLSPTSSPPEDQERINFINEQLDNIQTQIEDTESEIESLQTLLGELNSALQIQETEQQIAALQGKLTTLQSNYANLVSNTQQGATNTLTILEPANLPAQPINQNAMVTIALASAIGFSLAAAAAYLLEYLDKSIKTPEEAARIFNSPVLGYIPEIPEGEGERPYVADHPRSTIAEAFRSLRINLEFAAVEKPLKTIFVTSSDPSAGKTSMAANLAIVMAQGGHKVTLVDADLRRPNIHGYLGISNSEGLNQVFKGELEVKDIARTWEPGNITVLTAGSPPPNPAELLGSPKMNEILATVSEDTDFVVIDGPPFLVADASILASKVDGVLIVVQPGQTHRDSAESIAEQMKRVGSRMAGVVFNRIPRSSVGYYGKYWYYSPQYTSPYIAAAPFDDEGDAVGPRQERKTLPAFWRRIRSSTNDVNVGIKGADRRSEDGEAAVPSVAVSDNGIGDADFVPRPPQARAVLRWEDTVGKRQKLVLREMDTILIGRDRINDVIIHSRHVSRRHAVITWRKTLFEIADLGSTNGTFVNDQQADRPIELNHGDVIRLFDLELTFELLSRPDEKSEVEAEIPEETGDQADAPDDSEDAAETLVDSEAEEKPTTG